MAVYFFTDAATVPRFPAPADRRAYFIVVGNRTGSLAILSPVPSPPILVAGKAATA